MRQGTVKWYRGKHPVYICFTGFLADLEILVGKDNVIHGPFGHIRTHPEKPDYSFRFYDEIKHQVKIVGKYDGKLQEFYVSVCDPSTLPILRAFVEYYPDPNYLAYVPAEQKKREETSVGIEELVLDSD